MSKIVVLALLVMCNFSTTVYASPFSEKIKTHCTEALESLEEYPEFDADTRKEVHQIINEFELPEADMPDAALATKLENEDPERFYHGYGSEVEPDYKKSRLIAFAQLKRLLEDGKSFEYSIDTMSVLTMVYANGQGVKRNLDLAIIFGLLLPLGYQDFRYTLSALLHYVESNRDCTERAQFGGDFSISPHMITRFMTEYAQHIARNQEQASELKEITALNVKYTLQEAEAFEKLFKVVQKFIRLKSENETDCSGDMALTFVYEQEKDLADTFIHSLRKFTNNEFPHFTKQQLIEADKELNSTYQLFLKEIEKETADSQSEKIVTKEKIKQTQVLWIQYQDAWVEFFKIKYPQVSADSVKTWLTKERTRQLDALVTDIAS